GVDLLEQSIKLPRVLQLLDPVLARGLVRLLLVRHGHDSYRSSRYGLHRPSDTAREQRPDPLSCLTRTVELLPSTEPGMGTIQIHGPIPEILAQWKRLDESARAVQRAQRTALREGTPIPHD